MDSGYSHKSGIYMGLVGGIPQCLFYQSGRFESGMLSHRSSPHPADTLQGPKYGFIWAGSNAISVIFFFFYKPEMKGRALEELDKISQTKTPTWEFSQFQWTIRDEAALDMAERTGVRMGKEGEVSEQVEEKNEPGR